MPFVTARGLRFHIATIGDGPPVVMIHGLLLGNLASWYFTVAPALAERRRVFLYDLRGHGRSERTATGYDVATMTDDLAALLEPFGADPVALVGHSYGALIALRFALQHPARVRALVLVEAPLPPPRFADLDRFLSRGPEDLLTELPDVVRSAVAKGQRQARKFVESIGALMFSTSLVTDARAEIDIPDETLRTVMCPTLCVYGRSSSAHSVGHRLAAAIPKARLVTLEGGHFLHLDSPALLTQEIDAFLRALE
jgi:pimeloyl-ACP methyl ester carboxylesterase